MYTTNVVKTIDAVLIVDFKYSQNDKCYLTKLIFLKEIVFISVLHSNIK